VDRREFWVMPGIETNLPVAGEALRYADGSLFVIRVRHASAGDVTYKLVRVE